MLFYKYPINYCDLYYVKLILLKITYNVLRCNFIIPRSTTAIFFLFQILLFLCCCFWFFFLIFLRFLVAVFSISQLIVYQNARSVHHENCKCSKSPFSTFGYFILSFSFLFRFYHSFYFASVNKSQLSPLIFLFECIFFLCFGFLFNNVWLINEKKTSFIHIYDKAFIIFSLFSC